MVGTTIDRYVAVEFCIGSSTYADEFLQTYIHEDSLEAINEVTTEVSNDES
jgi:hypothetical protein